MKGRKGRRTRRKALIPAGRLGSTKETSERRRRRLPLLSRPGARLRPEPREARNPPVEEEVRRTLGKGGREIKGPLRGTNSGTTHGRPQRCRRRRRRLPLPTTAGSAARLRPELRGDLDPS